MKRAKIIPYAIGARSDIFLKISIFGTLAEQQPRCIS
jgi:hypothetical protein